MSASLASAKLASELWKILRVFERVVPQLPQDQQTRVHAQLRFARGRLDSLLEESGLKLTSFEGHTFEPNLPVTVINADEVESSDGLVVTQTLEPSVVADGQVLIMGKVVIGHQQGEHSDEARGPRLPSMATTNPMQLARGRIDSIRSILSDKDRTAVHLGAHPRAERPAALVLVMLVVASVLAAVVFSACTQAADLIGRASVIDGDTIEIHGQRVRLFGIDAPESRQFCEADGKRYHCGQQAALALADHIGQRTVSCERAGRRSHNRVVAVCYVGGEDLSGWLTLQGWAVSDRHYSLDYVDEEEAARAAGRGLWRGSFAVPWEWRRGHR